MPAAEKDKKTVKAALASNNKGKKKAEAPAVENAPAREDTPIPKSKVKGKKKAEAPAVDDQTPEAEEPQKLLPQENGCEVTDVELQSICLMDFYAGLPALKYAYSLQVTLASDLIYAGTRPLTSPISFSLQRSMSFLTRISSSTSTCCKTTLQLLLRFVC